MLGSTEMPVSELMALQKGSTVALNRRIGEPVDVVVNGRRIARGEITVLENDPSRFGITADRGQHRGEAGLTTARPRETRA